MGEPVWLTADDVSERVRVSLKLVYRAIKAGDLQAARIGGRGEYRIKGEWVEAWMEKAAEHRQPGEGA